MKGKFSASEIADMTARISQPPVCPFCRDAMTRVHIETEDGWVHAWMCDCEPDYEYKFETCTVCNGGGYIPAGVDSEHEHECSVCHGEGEVMSDVQ